MVCVAADPGCPERYYGLVGNNFGARTYSDDFQFEGHSDRNDTDPPAFHGVANVSVMKTIPLYELRASQSLGANPFITFFRIFWPRSIPGIGAGGLLGFLSCLLATTSHQH
ncbi:MAG: hypothetical protein CM1200mP18_15990 [Gammaproteobacteria bacterium]|nr:MAG: hypothetical protein CM1200mP18_15990 [Gammaproteobacteria bacterium]